jgi:ABC-type sugar transport system substrate-binding protein
MRNAFALATLLVASLLAGAAGPAGGAAVAAPQGTIAFVSERSGNVEIYTVRADGSRLGQLTKPSRRHGPALLAGRKQSRVLPRTG